jgi:hypothetical protein
LQNDILEHSVQNSKTAERAPVTATGEAEFGIRQSAEIGIRSSEWRRGSRLSLGAYSLRAKFAGKALKSKCPMSKERQITKDKKAGAFLILNFEFLSAFEFRNSDFGIAGLDCDS